MIKITREIHFVNDLRVNMLIDINIQIVEKIIIDILQRKFILFNCSKFFIFIDVFNVDKRVKRIIKNKQIVSLSSISITNMLIQIRNNLFLSKKRDYMFHSKTFFNFDVESDVFIRIIDVNISMIQIRNVTSKIVIIFRHVKLKRIMNYEKKNCYLTSFENVHLTIKSKKIMFKNLFKLTFVDLIVAIVYFANSTFSFMISIFVDFIVKSKFETITFRKIIIYNDSIIRVKLKKIINKFFEL